MENLKKYIKKFVFNRKTKSKSKLQELINANFVKVGNNSLVQSLNIDIRKKELNKTFLSIGNDSVVNGNYIFENEFGKISVGNRTFIGGGNFISISNISIGNDVLISWGCTIMDNNAHSVSWSKRRDDVKDWKKGLDEGKIGHYKNWEHISKSSITISDKVWIGFNCIILKGVHIGEGSVVGSGSVVTKNVPDWTIVAGNPAVIIREISKEER